MKKLHKIGKFYTRIILKHIGIFIFVGLLFVVFHDHGWLPNSDLYAISQLIYAIILPAFIAYEGGRLISGTEGGILAVLAVSGLLVSENSVGILGAMVAGPLAGVLWKYGQRYLEKRAGSSVQMLMKNLTIAVLGGILAIDGYYLISPVLGVITEVAYRMVNMLVNCKLIALAGIVIEPAKVFFLNNMVNHAVLVPMGIEQVQDMGKSVLFLLETNPGPGLGLMLALFCSQKERRSEYTAAMIAQTIGGIHEVYFPFVLSNLSLLLPLIFGGIAGDLCFVLMDAGLMGAVSPGSLLTILIMAGKGGILPVLMGIGISTAVTFVGSILILRHKNQKVNEPETEKKEMKEEIHQVIFVCEGGVGSSAMGAALFRRTLAREGITDVCAEACAADLVSERPGLLVCQKDYYNRLPEEMKKREIYVVESLLKAEEYVGLAEEIKKRNGERNGIYTTHETDIEGAAWRK